MPVEFTPDAEEALQKFPLEDQELIWDAIDAERRRRGGLARLAFGSGQTYRLDLAGVAVITLRNSIETLVVVSVQSPEEVEC
jgi:hypothetical protein